MKNIIKFFAIWVLMIIVSILTPILMLLKYKVKLKITKI